MFYSRTNNEQFYPSLKNKHQPTRSLGWQQNLRTTTGTESNDIDIVPASKVEIGFSV